MARRFIRDGSLLAEPAEPGRYSFRSDPSAQLMAKEHHERAFELGHRDALLYLAKTVMC
jgi:hypothetical protein